MYIVNIYLNERKGLTEWCFCQRHKSNSYDLVTNLLSCFVLQTAFFKYFSRAHAYISTQKKMSLNTQQKICLSLYTELPHYSILKLFISTLWLKHDKINLHTNKLSWIVIDYHLFTYAI